MQATATQPAAQPVTTAVEKKGSGLLDMVLEQTTSTLDGIASRYCDAIADPEIGRLYRAMLMADGIEKIEKALTPGVMSRVMRLMNSKLGFMTDRGPQAFGDKNKTPYDEATVKRCFIQSLMQGLNLIGNQWNMIASNLYITKEGYEHKLAHLAGLTDLEVAPGVPYQHNGQTAVRVAANWKLDGIPDRLIGPDGKPGRPIPIITNQYTSVDAMQGKATRKALKAVWLKIHGSGHTLCDMDDDTAEVQDGGMEKKSRVALGGGNGHPPAKVETPAETKTPEPAEPETSPPNQGPAHSAEVSGQQVADEPGLDEREQLIDGIRSRIEMTVAAKTDNEIARLMQDNREQLGDAFGALSEQLQRVKKERLQSAGAGAQRR